MRTLVEYGLANAAAATALALLAVLVGLVVRRPAVRNAMWLLVFVRLLLPPVWSVHVPFPDLFVEPETSAIAPPVAASKGDVPVDDVALTGDDGESGPDTLTDAPGPAGTPPAPPPPSSTAVTEPPAPTKESHRPTAATYGIVCALWLAGSVLVLGRSARRVMRFRRALRDAFPAPLEIQVQADGLARAMGLRRCPPILLVPGRLWPALWMPGLWRRQARLILPAGLLPLLNEEQRAGVLAHELAHLRRGDPWVRWLELVVCGIYWWHPLLGWFRRKLRESEEECCDMWVVSATSARKSYATALVEAVAFLGGPDRSPAPVLASAAGPVRNLQRRVTMIMSTTRPARLTRLGLASVLTLGGLGLAFGPAMAQPERKDPPPRDERPKEPPRERPDGPPRDRERGSERDLDEARADVERARQAARAAMERLRDAEARLENLQARRLPRRPADGDRGPRDRGPVDRSPRDRGPGDRAPEGPRGPGFGRGPGPDLQALQMQIEELRRAMEDMRREMRREMRRGPDDRGPDRHEGPKGPPRRGSGDNPPGPEKPGNRDSGPKREP